MTASIRHASGRALVLALLALALLAMGPDAYPESVARSASFAMDPSFLMPPNGEKTIGDSHGDIAVSPAGDIYVSVQGGNHPGVQIYDAKGRYLRNLPDAPPDLHGFIIAPSADGTPNIFGARLLGQQIIQMTLDGKVVLVIPAAAIPDQYKTSADGRLYLFLTGVAVAPNGNIYAVDGYGRDFIHRFDRTGHYLGSFGGRSDPWDFSQCHQIALDPRFTPPRLLCADRLHGRVIQMDLEGNVLGTLADGFRWPSALAIYKNELAVAELEGRVTIVGLKGEALASIGANDNPDQVKTNKIPPERCDPTLFYAPHGIVYQADGNLLVTEWSEWGRVVRIVRH